MSDEHKIEKKPLGHNYNARFFVAALLYLLLFLLVFHPTLYILFPNLRQEISDRLLFFLAATISSTIIVFLIPVIVRGSFGEKILSAILLIPAVGFGFLGWLEIIGDFIDTYFWH